MIINEKRVEVDKKTGKFARVVGPFIIILSVLLTILTGFSFLGLGVLLGVMGVAILRLDKKSQYMAETFYKYKEIIGERDVISIQELASGTQEDKEVVLNNLRWMMKERFFEDVQIDSRDEFFQSRDYVKLQTRRTTATATDMVNNFFEDFGDFGNLGENMQELQSDINEMMQNMETEISNIQMDATQGNRKIIIEWNSSGRTKTPKKDVFATAVCECCGGSTRIKVGSIGVCDYCGAPIKIEI